MRRFVPGLFALAAVFLISSSWLGCTRNPNSNSGSSAPATFQGEYPIKITATVGMVADLLRAIGNEEVEVTQLIGSGVDPHLYTTNSDHTKSIYRSDAVFYSGLLLEGKMSELLGKISKPTFAAAETLPTALIQRDDSDAHSSGHPDPHVWMNVEMWSQVAQAIGDELSRYDAANAAKYQERTHALRKELAKLHEYGVQIMKCIPEENRVLVTSHDAFRYFGAAYGIEVQAVQGISTESAAGLSRINELVNMLVERKVKAVFVESSVPRASIEALIDGAKAQGHEVVIGGELFSDAMGNSGDYEGTYIGMMDHNLTQVARQLGCTSVPPNGLNGKLHQ